MTSAVQIVERQTQRSHQLQRHLLRAAKRRSKPEHPRALILKGCMSLQWGLGFSHRPSRISDHLGLGGATCGFGARCCSNRNMQRYSFVSFVNAKVLTPFLTASF